MNVTILCWLLIITLPLYIEVDFLQKGAYLTTRKGPSDANMGMLVRIWDWKQNSFKSSLESFLKNEFFESWLLPWGQPSKEETVAHSNCEVKWGTIAIRTFFRNGNDYLNLNLMIKVNCENNRIPQKWRQIKIINCTVKKINLGELKSLILTNKENHFFPWEAVVCPCFYFGFFLEAAVHLSKEIQ